jgi:cell division septation protein DedD
LKVQTNESIQAPSIKSKNKINEQLKIKLTPSKKDKEYYVQIASFKNEFNAKKLYKSIELNNAFLSLEKVSTSNDSIK